jgi:hypothetical protein
MTRAHAEKMLGGSRGIHETFITMSFTKLSGFDLNDYAGVRLPPHTHPRFPYAFQLSLLVCLVAASNPSLPPLPPSLPLPDLPHQP